MDRQINKSTLRREKHIRLLKFSAGAGVFFIVILIVGLVYRPAVDERSILLSKTDTGNIELSVSASGRVVPAFEEIITSPIDSRIVEVYKKGGDSLQPGDPILRLDLLGAENDYRNMLDQEEMKKLELEKLKLMNKGKLSQMEMNLKVQRMELSRKEVNLKNERYLDSLGGGTADKVREAELGYNVALLQLREDEHTFASETQLVAADEKVKELELSIFRKELAQVKKTYEDARILSPRKGVLTFVSNEIGAQVGKGTKVAIVSDLSHFKVEGEIADSYGEKIAVGYRALLKVGREKFTGIVSNLTPLSKNGMLSFSLQLEDDGNKLLRSGLKGEVYILNSLKENVLRIANGDYYNGPGAYDLYVKEGDMLCLRNVKLGECNFEYVEVLGGLQEGEQVVTGGELPRGKQKIKLR